MFGPLKGGLYFYILFLDRNRHVWHSFINGSRKVRLWCGHLCRGFNLGEWLQNGWRFMKGYFGSKQALKAALRA